jgi:hypothetical protein
MPILDSKMYTDDEVEAIKRGIRGYMGFEERCAKAVKSGLTDEDLRAWLGYELGIFGGSYAKDWVTVNVKGQANPCIWLGDSWTNDEPPTLSGKHLLNVTRQLYGIGLPCPEGQLTLF